MAKVWLVGVGQVAQVLTLSRQYSEAAETSAAAALVSQNAAAASQSAAATSAATATTQAATATTQAGISTTQAGIATTQAGIATTQAGIATTKAGEAAASAAAALTSENNAATAEANAETAEANAETAAADAQASALTVMGSFYPGRPHAGALMFEWTPPAGWVFPAGLAGSLLHGRTAATAQWIGSLKKNDVEFGTATVAAAGNDAVMASAAGSGSFNGTTDLLQIFAPASADATFADISWRLARSA